MPKTRRSPLKAKPLRVAGQSLDEQIGKVIDDDWNNVALMIAALWGMAIVECARWYWSIPPNPALVLVMAVIGSGVGWLKLRKIRRVLANLKQGRDGERAVAELLDRMREQGYRVFHDVLGPDFNVDHVLVGPHGVYVIETKTISKPTNGNATVAYDGERVIVGGYDPDRDPVAQASALARWVAELIQESTGRKCDVRPVVLFPGWFVESRGIGKPHVWVLNGKELPAFLAREPVRLGAEDVKLISFHLSRYVRAQTTLS